MQASDRYAQDRLAKLERIAALGVDPWGGRFEGRQSIGAVRALWQEEFGDRGPNVRVAGRVMARRHMGRLVFMDLQDWTGRIQICAGKGRVSDLGWELIELTDLGDLVGVDGRLGKTRTGELTIFVQAYHFLTKSLRTPPEKWHGLKDVELRYRQRYLDLIYNDEARQVALRRARMVNLIRNFFLERGFIEVETPTLHTVAGGAAARPFITHHNALDMDLYLRIALELHLKRLLVGGLEKVFELGRVFRNEGISARHNPEFTMLEVYQAYADYRDMMELTEEVIEALLRFLDQDGVGYERSPRGGWLLPVGEQQLDLSRPWPRRSYAELFREYVGVDLEDLEAVRHEAVRRQLDPRGKHPDVVIGELFEKVVEPQLVGPVFVVDYPASLCPLTKRKRGNERWAERFELFLGGMEIANAYTELNDPLLQEELFRRQLEGLPEEESMARMDEDFLLALRTGMPPAGGLGIGVDRLVMVLLGQPTIREVILFPLLRPERTPAISAGS
jgi:lysyl-tRNA synthetase class 2